MTTDLYNPLRYWHDLPQDFPAVDASDAQADREDSLSDRYGFQLGEDLGLCRMEPPSAWPSDDMARGHRHGLTRPQKHADVYLRKLLRLRVNAYARNLPFSSAITTEYLRSITVTVCPVSGTPLTQGTMTDSDWSVDRLDNGLGYVPGNICFLSTRVNRLKGTAELDDLLQGGAAKALLHGPAALAQVTPSGLQVLEVLRLAALVTAPACIARSAKPREFPPLAMAPRIWVTPQCQLAGVHVACARTRLETAAHKQRSAWLRHLGPDTWRQSNRLVDRIRSRLSAGVHPADIWLNLEPMTMLLEISDAFFLNPPKLPQGMVDADALRLIKAHFQSVSNYAR